jgi:hypothetical protein
MVVSFIFICPTSLVRIEDHVLFGKGEAELELKEKQSKSRVLPALN